MHSNNQKKSNKGDRVIFPKEKQKEFLEKIPKILKISWPKFYRIIKIHPRSCSDWRREKYSLPLSALIKIREVSGVKLPNDIEIKKAFWSTSKAGQISGKKVYEKYGTVGGNAEYRKKQWRKWWNSVGKYKKDSINTPISIVRPNHSERLAEFIGIVLGDGSITKRQVVICLHYRDDAEYGEFVAKLARNLFSVPVVKHFRESCSINMFVISRSALVDFFVNRLGLSIGNKVKHQVDLPQWIKQNKKFAAASLRGLMDTDGSVFSERHKINAKIYSYPRLAFTNYSKPLIMTVFNILKDLKFEPKIRSGGVRVTLEKRQDILRYFKIIKSHNQKHIKRLKKISGGVG